MNVGVFNETAMEQSFWIEESGNAQRFGAFKGKKEVDVAIIGAGITGLTAALRLAQTGKQVVILEAQHIGAGTTGHSSCELTTEIDPTFEKIIEGFGIEKARKIASSRKEAIDFIETIIHIYNISCDFRRIDGFLYTENPEETEALKRQGRKAAEAGLNVSFSRNNPLPFPVQALLKYRHQAEFNSKKYLNGLSKLLTQKNVEIFENSRVIDIEEKENEFIVFTDQGEILAKDVIQATHYPIFANKSQILTSSYRSYVIALRITGSIPKAIYWDTAVPYHYFRMAESEKGNVLIAGGEDYKTGHESENAYLKLEEYVRQRFPVGMLLGKWSSQYYISTDGLPYIGINPFGGRSLIATGYGGDGLVYGTVAGIVLSDLLSNIENDWKELFSPSRFIPVPSSM